MQNEPQKRDFKGIWIPKEIYLNTELSWTEKILYCEINSLDLGDGCYASNEYFANFLGIKERAVRHALLQLKNLHLIEQTEFDGRRRTLKIVDAGQTGKKMPGRQAEKCHHNNIDYTTGNIDSTNPNNYIPFRSTNNNPSNSPSGENQTADEVTIALSNFKHAWNEVLVPRFEDENGKTVIPKIATFSGTRRAHAKQRLTELAAYMKEHGIKKGLLEYFIKDFVADRFEHSQFLQGRVQPRTTGGRPFEFSADRVLQPNIFNHMLEYMYDDRPEYRR